MLFAPEALGNRKLRPDELKADKKHCRKIGPCGLGEKAVYLNSFFIDRNSYVTYTDIMRVFKRVAMSRGGYSGKGLFGSIPYLVVQISNGTEKQCNFKYEEDVDRFLAALEEAHPEIPTHSKEAEARLRRAREEEEARYVKNLSVEAETSLLELRRAKRYLDAKPEIGDGLSLMARRKRSVDGIRKSNLAIAVLIALLAAFAVAVGLVEIARGNSSWAVYFVLFGLAGMFFTAAAGILPTAKHNKKSVQRDWDKAVEDAAAYLGGYGEGESGQESTGAEVYGQFPVPAQYAHSIVLERMIRVIREGKAESVADAYEVMKTELKALDHTKTVTQKEHDEIVAVKPMFIVMDYR